MLPWDWKPNGTWLLMALAEDGFAFTALAEEAADHEAFTLLLIWFSGYWLLLMMLLLIWLLIGLI